MQFLPWSLCFADTPTPDLPFRDQSLHCEKLRSNGEAMCRLSGWQFQLSPDFEASQSTQPTYE